MFAARGNFITNAVTGGSNDPYFDNVVLLLKGETATDSSKYNWGLTASSGDASVSTARSKFGSSSLRFVNRGRYTVNSSANNAAFAWGTGPVTIDFWLNTVSYTSPASTVFASGSWNGTSSDGRWWVNFNEQPTWKVLVNNQLPAIGTITMTNNTWDHYAITRNASWQWKVYKNGVKIGTDLAFSGGNDGGRNMFAGFNVAIGNDTTGSSYNGDFYLDHLRVTKGIVRYTTTFTPPTEADY